MNSPADKKIIAHRKYQRIYRGFYWFFAAASTFFFQLLFELNKSESERAAQQQINISRERKNIYKYRYKNRQSISSFSFFFFVGKNVIWRYRIDLKGVVFFFHSASAQCEFGIIFIKYVDIYVWNISKPVFFPFKRKRDYEYKFWFIWRGTVEIYTFN